MTKFDPQNTPSGHLHHRRSIRLKGYDYAQAGAYYVTIVAWRRDFLFGEVVNGEMILNEHGLIADGCWREIPKHFPHVELGAYVVMPNHVHAIIVINPMGENRIATNTSQSVGARHASPLRPRGASSGSLGAIVGSFKSAVTKRIGRELNETGIWQRNYGACPEPVEGNTSSAMRRICRIKRITLRRIRFCGMKMTRIQPI
ncbi:MAG: transposase [Anaerolineales bacterium]|nr:transposase [Anaerolineales bacterium]